VEEVYLGRILARAVGDLARSRPALLRRLKGAGTKYGDWKDGGLEDLVSATLADLFAPSHEESQATSSITEVMA
jgi:hypothetical protein